MVAGRCIDQLRRYANTGTGLSNAAFDDVVDCECRVHRGQIDPRSSELKRRITGNYGQRVVARKLGDDIFCNPVGEIFLLGGRRSYW